MTSVVLTVNVGSYQDPVQFPGFAHLIEHCVFLGNKKYPEQNGLDSRINEFGGKTNAVTEANHTQFYLDLMTPNDTCRTSEILDQFASMFVDPIFSEEGTRSEMNAIDSEWMMQQTNVEWT